MTFPGFSIPLPVLTQILIALAPYLVPLLVFLLGKAYQGFMAQLPANQRPVVQEIVKTAVVAAEKLSSDALNGPGKKQVAIDFIEQELDSWGIKVPSSVISSMIEQAVAALPQLMPASTAQSALAPIKGK